MHCLQTKTFSDYTRKNQLLNMRIFLLHFCQLDLNL